MVWVIILAVLLLTLKAPPSEQASRCHLEVERLYERVEELERTAMRKGWPYVEDVISVDERSFHHPQHGEEGRG